MSENLHPQTNNGQSVSDQNNPTSPSPLPNYSKPKDSFVKLAMRNMVKKGNTSLFHFFLTVLGVFGTLIGLAVIFH